MSTLLQEFASLSRGAEFIRADLHIHSFGPHGSPDVADATMTLFPLSAANGFSGVYNGIGGILEVENPNVTAATINFSTLDIRGSGQTAAPFSIPAGSWGIFTGGDRGSLIMDSNLPVRAVFSHTAVLVLACLYASVL
jgi:hypothetical protein